MDRLEVQPATNAQPPLPVALSTPRRKSRRTAMANNIRRSWQLYLMLLLPIIWLALFAYIPMWGAQIAFRKYVPAGGFAGISSAEWVGCDHFVRFFISYN